MYPPVRGKEAPYRDASQSEMLSLTELGRVEVTQKQRSSYNSLTRQLLLNIPTHRTPQKPLHTNKRERVNASVTLLA